jgi:pyruvate dehydrogenase E2 component (dihydrolipoamide acetyltransferase)
MSEFRMPQLGADMEAGTLARWVKQPGEPVKRGEVIAIVETEKGAIEIEVFEDGVLDRTLIQPGQKVPVGTPLALIRGATEPPPTVRASPAARRLAKERGVDLARMAGSGPGGAVTVEDVERVTPAVVTTTADKASAMRHAIGAAMARSKREIPHLYLGATIDMTTALGWLSAANEARPVEERMLPIALLIKAVARAAVEVPEVNGYYRDGGFRAGAGTHVGCAIALRDGGLVAPAIHDTDRKSLTAVMSELMDLVARARGGTLRSSELADPTITLTNLGDLGVEQAFAVIYPPQVAIVAFGKMIPRPWAIDGRLEVRTLINATISADHRVVDGRRAGQFLAAIDRWLQTPEHL